MTATYNQVVIATINNESLNFGEFQLFNHLGDNVALLGTAVSSSTSFNVNGQASNGIDGNLDSELRLTEPTNGIVHTGAGGVWTLTLNTSYTEDELHRAVLYNRTGTSFGEDARIVGASITLISDNSFPDLLIGTATIDPIQEFIITLPTLVLVPKVASITAIVGEVDGATSYRLTLQEDGSSTVSIAQDNFTELTQTITNVNPETLYTVELFADSGSGYESVAIKTATTLANTAENYDTTEFGSGGKFSLKSLEADALALLLSVINDIFTTGDVLDIELPGVLGKNKRSSFVKKGEEVEVVNSEAVLIPFDASGGTGQTISLGLSDTSSVTVAYDESTNAITVEGSTYSTNQYFVLDGKKITVLDL